MRVAYYGEHYRAVVAFVREFPVLRDEAVARGPVLARVGRAEFQVFRESRGLLFCADGFLDLFLKDEDGAVREVDLAGELPSFFPVLVERGDFGKGNRFELEHFLRSEILDSIIRSLCGCQIRSRFLFSKQERPHLFAPFRNF